MSVMNATGAGAAVFFSGLSQVLLLFHQIYGPGMKKTRNVTFLFFSSLWKDADSRFFFYCCYYGVEGLSCSRFVGDGCVYVYIITAVSKVFIYLKLNRWLLLHWSRTWFDAMMWVSMWVMWNAGHGPFLGHEPWFHFSWRKKKKNAGWYQKKCKGQRSN